MGRQRISKKKGDNQRALVLGKTPTWFQQLAGFRDALNSEQLQSHDDNIDCLLIGGYSIMYMKMPCKMRNRTIPGISILWYSPGGGRLNGNYPQCYWYGMQYFPSKELARYSRMSNYTMLSSPLYSSRIIKRGHALEVNFSTTPILGKKCANSQKLFFTAIVHARPCTPP